MENELNIDKNDLKKNGDVVYTSSVAYLKGAKAAVTFSDNFFYEDKDIKPREIQADGKAISFIPWGDENIYPNDVIAVIEKNPVASPLLEFKIDLAYGMGLKIGQMINGEFVEYTNQEIENNPELKIVDEFLTDNNINSDLGEILTDINWFNWSSVELILSNDKKIIAELNARETSFSRWSEMESDGKIKFHLYSAKWAEGNINDEDIIVTPVLDFKKPGLDLKRKMGIKLNNKGEYEKPLSNKYIYPIRFETPGRKYYPSPYWHSVIKSGWIDFANAIPTFKKAMMTNNMNIKYHVEISADYFPRIFAEEGLTKREDCEKRRIKELQNINDFLTGAENVGKPIVSYYKVTPDGRVEIHDIKITTIDTKVGGEYIQDSQEASAMTYTAFNVHPNLIGVIPSKNSSNLSGSDKRELLRIAQTFQVRKRDKFLELMYLIKEINKWPKELVFAINDMILTTLDQGKEVQEIQNT